MLEFELKKPENEKWGCCMLLQHPVFNNRYLVCQRAPGEREEPGSWGFVGGKVDAGERVCDAVVREVFEETGLRVHDYKYIGKLEEGAYLDFIFVSNAWSGELKLDPNECSDYSWLALDEIKAYAKTYGAKSIFSYTLATVTFYESNKGV